MKSIIAGPMLLIMMLLMASGAFAASLSLSPNPATPVLGQNFVVSLNLDTATQTKGYSIRFHYNTDVLSFVQAVKGPLFTGFTVGWWRVFNGPPNEDPGVLRVECIIFNPGIHTTGPGNLLNLTFNPIAQGYSDLHLSDVKLFGPDGSLTYGNIWDDGSVVIGTGSSYASALALLEGPFDGTGMSALPQDLLPLVSPYYADAESIDYVEPDMVDWILLELLDSQDGSVLYSRSLILHQDGRIGSFAKPYIMVPGAPPQGYYIRIRHRNHLALTSTVPISFVASGVPVLHDLRQATLIDTGSGVKNLGGSIWGMKAGDANADGSIDQDDHYLSWRSQAGMRGYLDADLDLDGFVLPNDLLEIWRPNAIPFSMPPIDPVQSSISFTTSDLRMEAHLGGEHIGFDIDIAAGTDGARLGTGIIVLDYSDITFGTNLVAQNRISVSPGTILSSVAEPYTLIVRDLADSKVAVVFEYDADSVGAALIPLAASQLLHIRIVLQCFDSATGFAFDQSLMQHQQYQSDRYTLFAPLMANAVNAIIPSRPANLSISSTGSETALSWTAINGYTYNVYARPSQSSDWQQVAVDIDGNSWTDSSTDQIKFYKITAVTGRGDR